MEHLPQRFSLVSETAATLKKWISTGKLREVLPGELQLKRQLEVSRDTLRQALALLVQEGWLLPAHKGQQRRIFSRELPPAQTPPVRRLPVTFLSPFPLATRTTLLEMEDTRLRLAQLGHSLHYLAPEVFQLKRPERQLERLVAANPSAVWVLFLATRSMQEWFEARKIPALIYNSVPFPGVNLPCVISDWESAAFHAGVQLVRQGHRVIGLLEHKERLPGLLLVERGLQRALATTGGQGRLRLMLEQRTPESFERALEKAFALRGRPTSMVITNTAQLLTCYPWLVSRGIRIPADLSLVSLVNDSWFTELQPPLCYYRPDSSLTARSVAERVLELLATGRVMRKSQLIPLEYVPGGTIGPAPGTEHGGER